MSFGKRRGYSDCIRGVDGGNLLNAQDFAASIGRGLNTAVDINWSRTTSRDDIHGSLLRSWRKAAGRVLRERAGGLTCTWVRERPTRATAGPNAHLNCHIPDRLFSPIGFSLRSSKTHIASCLMAASPAMQMPSGFRRSAPAAPTTRTGANIT
jgi:hypothetical protein